MATGFSDSFNDAFRMMAHAKEAKQRRKLQEEMASWKKGLIENQTAEGDLRRQLLERRLQQEMAREKEAEKERKMKLLSGMAGEFASKTGMGSFAKGMGDALSRAGQMAKGQRIGRAMGPQAPDPMKELELEEQRLKVEQLRRQMDAENDDDDPLAGLPSTEEVERGGYEAQLAKIDEMIAKDQEALAKGDEKAGLLQFLPGLGTRRDERLERNLEQRREMEAKLRGQPQQQRSTELKPGRVIVQNGKQYEFLGGDPNDPKNYKEL